MRVGVVSDTHGLLRPEVPALLAGCDAILHAGDVGGAEVLARLGEVAPVTAVRGNVDVEGATARLPESAEGDLDGLAYRMAHLREDALAALSGPGADRFRLVVFGHSHRPEICWHGDCLLLNPGACGRRRFSLPLTLARLTIDGGRLVPELLAVG
jgi:uncharacterized protein